jgi:hypothetical protein
MKKPSLAVGIVVLASAASLAVAGFALHEKDARKPEDPLKALWAGNYGDLRAEWKEDIEKNGVKAAYERYKLDGKNKPFGIQHTFAHIMGELIYESEGVAGISDCDPTFSYGCYHSLAGKAIIDHGLSVVADLDRACNENGVNTGCLHGIGHGILGYLGYGNVLPALEACRATSWKGPLGGCPGGVFMEENFHTMESVESSKARVPDKSDLYAPCDAVESDFSQECFYYQALWWVRALSDDYGEAYVQAGALCDQVPTPADRKACFWGMGESASSEPEFDPEKTLAYCRTLSGQSSQLFCRQGARRIFFADPRTRDFAPRLCDGLSGGEASACLDPMVLGVPGIVSGEI